MKHLVFGAIMLLVMFGAIGCTESPQWEETTLTVVNNSTEDITTITVFAGNLSRTTNYNILDADLVVGESIVIPLPPVLHPSASANIYIGSETLFFDRDFTYKEGAEVVITFKDTDDADIVGGDFEEAQL